MIRLAAGISLGSPRHPCKVAGRKMSRGIEIWGLAKSSFQCESHGGIGGRGASTSLPEVWHDFFFFSLFRFFLSFVSDLLASLFLCFFFFFLSFFRSFYFSLFIFFLFSFVIFFYHSLYLSFFHYSLSFFFFLSFIHFFLSHRSFIQNTIRNFNAKWECYVKIISHV